MEKPSEIQFADERVKRAFDELKNSTTEDKQLYAWLLRAFDDVQKNVFCGIRNLWKYNLPNAWRLLYSIEGRDVKIISIILEWLDHKNYERRFKY